MRIVVNVTGNVATLSLGGRFDFNAHDDFKEIYDGLLANKDVTLIEIGMWDVDYMDSAALGMLLILREHARAVNKQVVLSKPNHMVSQILDLANMAYSEMVGQPSHMRMLGAKS